MPPNELPKVCLANPKADAEAIMFLNMADEASLDFVYLTPPENEAGKKDYIDTMACLLSRTNLFRSAGMLERLNQKGHKQIANRILAQIEKADSSIAFQLRSALSLKLFRSSSLDPTFDKIPASEVRAQVLIQLGQPSVENRFERELLVQSNFGTFPLRYSGGFFMSDEPFGYMIFDWSYEFELDELSKKCFGSYDCPDADIGNYEALMSRVPDGKVLAELQRLQRQVRATDEEGGLFDLIKVALEHIPASLLLDQGNQIFDSMDGSLHKLATAQFGGNLTAAMNPFGYYNNLVKLNATIASRLARERTSLLSDFVRQTADMPASELLQLGKVMEAIRKSTSESFCKQLLDSIGNGKYSMCEEKF